MMHVEAAEEAENSEWTSRPHPEMEERIHPEMDESPNELKDPMRLFNTKEGFCVTFFGVVLPIFATVFAVMMGFEGIWRSFLLHPVEIFIESAAILSLPFANYKCWSSIYHNDQRRPMRLGLLNGVASGVALISFVVAASALALQYPLIDSVNGLNHSVKFGALLVASALSLAVSIYLTNALRRSKITRDAQMRSVLYSLAGSGLALAAFAIAEARPVQIRVAESMALADEISEKETGLRILRTLNAEREIKMNCADPHTSGLAGMFLPLGGDAERRLYFAATGKPYRDRQSDMSLMSNDYLRRHVVGAPVDGLSLHRSAIHGELHPNSLSSSLNWTFVFKNRTYTDQQARAEIAIPEGAVISDLTLWVNGKPQSGAFSATESARSDSSNPISKVIWTDEKQSLPVLITDLGRGRYLLQASPVPGRGELKVSVSITEPLKIDGSSKASLGIPHFIDTNFALTGKHQLGLRCDQAMQSTLKSITPAVTADGASTLTGELAEADISNSTFSVRLEKAQGFQRSLAADSFAGGYIVQERKERTVTAPKHLVVVVDASERMKKHAGEVAAALKKIPSGITTSVLLAGDKDDAKPVSLDEALKFLKEENFVGGQDNLHGIVSAAELAGASSGGAVMWIHGPQPGFNDEMYIVAPYAAAPKFYELALDDCLTDANEFFKNHREIGPFTALERGGPLQDDLEAFFSKWAPGAKETVIDSHRVAEVPATPELFKGFSPAKPENKEVAILKASGEVRQLIAKGKLDEAARMGIRYHIVTPVSGAVVTQNQVASSGGAASSATNTDNQSGTQYASAPMLQGATSGILVPQSEDTTVIYGLNTAGTVRVNNLANLEAFLNIMANCAECFGIALGGFNIFMGARNKAMSFPFPLGPRGRILLGMLIALVGLTIPGSIQWLTASARDANLFD